MARKSTKIVFSQWLNLGISLGFAIFIIFNLKVISAAKDTEEKGKDCFVKMDNATQEKLKYASNVCHNQTEQPDYTKFPRINITLEEYDFDDKCYYKCIYKEIGALSDVGLIKMNAAEAIFKSNMTKEMMEEMAKVWDGCIEDSEKINKPKGSEACKVISLHQFCISKRIEEDGVFKVRMNENDNEWSKIILHKYTTYMCQD